MSFISAFTRSIIRQECKRQSNLKFIRLLSTAENPTTDKAEDTKRYVPRFVLCNLHTFNSYFRSQYLNQFLSFMTLNISSN